MPLAQPSWTGNDPFLSPTGELKITRDRGSIPRGDDVSVPIVQWLEYSFFIPTACFAHFCNLRRSPSPKPASERGWRRGRHWKVVCTCDPRRNAPTTKSKDGTTSRTRWCPWRSASYRRTWNTTRNGYSHGRACWGLSGHLGRASPASRRRLACAASQALESARPETVWAATRIGCLTCDSWGEADAFYSKALACASRARREGAAEAGPGALASHHQLTAAFHRLALVSQVHASRVDAMSRMAAVGDLAAIDTGRHVASLAGTIAALLEQWLCQFPASTVRQDSKTGLRTRFGDGVGAVASSADRERQRALAFLDYMNERWKTRAEMWAAWGRLNASWHAHDTTNLVENYFNQQKYAMIPRSRIPCGTNHAGYLVCLGPPQRILARPRHDQPDRELLQPAKVCDDPKIADPMRYKSRRVPRLPGAASTHPGTPTTRPTWSRTTSTSKSMR